MESIVWHFRIGFHEGIKPEIIAIKKYVRVTLIVLEGVGGACTQGSWYNSSFPGAAPHPLKLYPGGWRGGELPSHQRKNKILVLDVSFWFWLSFELGWVALKGLIRPLKGLMRPLFVDSNR